MEQLKADVMIGPLSGDEAVYVANYAKSHPTKTFIIGTAGSQDPTLQIAPKNVFRYHGDGAQWNAGTGEIAYKKLGWRKAAIIMDDYSFGWTSGGRPHRRLLRGRRPDHEARVPAAEHDGLLLLRPAASAARHDRRDVLGRRRHRHGGQPDGVSSRRTAPLDPEEAHRQPVLRVPRRRQGRRPEGRRLLRRRLRHRARASRRRRRRRTRRSWPRWYPGLNGGNYADGFVYNYFNAAWALVQGLTNSKGAVGGGAAGRAAEDAPGRATRCPTRASSSSTRTGRRSRTSTRCRSSRTLTAASAPTIVGFVPNVDQSFGGLFKKTSPAARPHAAALREEVDAVAGQDQGRQRTA